MSILSLWRQAWEGQGRRCARCGDNVSLENTATDTYSFKVVCQPCYDKSGIDMVILDEWITASDVVV